MTIEADKKDTDPQRLRPRPVHRINATFCELGHGPMDSSSARIVTTSHGYQAFHTVCYRFPSIAVDLDQNHANENARPLRSFHGVNA